MVPAVVHPGEIFHFEVLYSPDLCLPDYTETFTFRWPSTDRTFRERTVRTKVFRQHTGCVTASAENAYVPASAVIRGPFEANVTVEGVCSVNAPMTVE